LIWRYRLSPEGEISHKELFYAFDDFGLDGMRCDEKGNLYVTRYGKGTVLILSPDATPADEIILRGKKCSNICFGGPDGRVCYVTIADDGSVETFRARHAGREYRMGQKRRG
jgi:sugar lactone lactonase YvrE